MDFKVAGSAQGISTFQLDVKTPRGLTLPQISRALQQVGVCMCKVVLFVVLFLIELLIQLQYNCMNEQVEEILPPLYEDIYT